MSVSLISVSQDTVVSNKHEERTRHYYVIFPTGTLERRLDMSATRAWERSISQRFAASPPVEKTPAGTLVYPHTFVSSLNLGDVIPQLSDEWKHSSQTSAVLTLVGPDLIRSALAQLAGTPLAPTAFSFGWVAYAFSNLVATLNDGTLMPQPEMACLVINADSGYELVLSSGPLIDVFFLYL